MTLAEGGQGRSRVRSVLTFIGFALALLAIWEGLKFIGGDPWRLGAWEWRPPIEIWFATDLNMPHIWEIIGALAAPVQRNQEASLAQFLFGAALYTWREAAIGFVAGAVLGIALAAAFVHSSLLERAFVPYVIASQTIPIVALAPMIVFAFDDPVVSVVIVTTYLTFFPVTIAMIRGLRSPDPRALELMRSYAASRWDTFWKVRLPASLPYLFTALKISATASVVGAIIGEGPGGIPDGLGRAIINFNNQYISGPGKLWATILAAALVGIAFFGLVRILELQTLRGRAQAATG
ncbi:MAG TPA: ABC transporter permease [Candidatus Limnocylindria bacterium]|jgi:NitT/TauT family transport system permease protein